MIDQGFNFSIPARVLVACYKYFFYDNVDAVDATLASLLQKNDSAVIWAVRGYMARECWKIDEAARFFDCAAGRAASLGKGPPTCSLKIDCAS